MLTAFVRYTILENMMENLKAKTLITLGLGILILIVNFYLYRRGLTTGYFMLLVHLYYPTIIVVALYTNYAGIVAIVVLSSLVNLIHLGQVFEVHTAAVTLVYPFISFLIGHLITNIRSRQVREKMRADALHFKEATEMNTLYQMSITLTSLTSLNAILRSMMRILSDELGMKRGQLALIESGASNTLLLKAEATHGFDPGDDDGILYGPWKEAVQKAAATAKGEVVAIGVGAKAEDDPSQGSRIYFYCLPIKVRGEVIGVMSLEKVLIPGISHQDDFRFLEIVCSIIGQVIQINRMLDSIRDMAVYNDNILGSMASGIVAFDLRGDITIFNRAAESMTNIARSEALGEGFSTLFSEQEALAAPIRRALEEAEVSTNLEIPLIRESGGPVILNLSTSMLRDSEGKVIGAVASFNDISQVKKLEEEIKRSDRLATAGEMAAGLAHEIRNPLSGLRGSAQLLASELGKRDPRTEYAQVIVEEVDRVEGIIRKLLDLVKPMKPHFKKGNVNGILTDTLSFVLKSVKSGVEFEIVKDLDPSLPPIIIDEEGIRGAFMNILLNAFQAMPDGGLLMIRTELEDEGREVKITVADTGPGVPQQERELIFNPFYTLRRGGTGLGLSVTSRIIAEHGGSIRVESGGSEGSAFAISLPILMH